MNTNNFVDGKSCFNQTAAGLTISFSLWNQKPAASPLSTLTSQKTAPLSLTAVPPTPDKLASVSSSNAHSTDLPSAAVPSANRRSALLHSAPNGGGSSAVPLLSQPTTQAPLPPAASQSSPISSSPSAPKLSRGSSGLQHSFLSRQSCRSKKNERTCNSSTGHLMHRRRQRNPKKKRPICRSKGEERQIRKPWKKI